MCVPEFNAAPMFGRATTILVLTIQWNNKHNRFKFKADNMKYVLHANSLHTRLIQIENTTVTVSFNTVAE